MSWTIRHQGSPRAVPDLSSVQVLEGLQDGQWEPTDEVKADDEPRWRSLEDHPQFAEAVADLEPPEPKPHEDETRLDMNPLIDVCLVLLIFFILTTTYETIRKVLDMPGGSAREKPQAYTNVKNIQDVRKFTVYVMAKMENGKPVIRVEDQVVPESLPELTDAIKKFVASTRKTEMLLDAKTVEWGTVVTIMDAAQGAGIQKTLFPKPAVAPAK
jgi:biopolymer transport protein ExbD